LDNRNAQRNRAGKRPNHAGIDHPDVEFFAAIARVEPLDHAQAAIHPYETTPGFVIMQRPPE
jgi:hypothetical protein